MFIIRGRIGWYNKNANFPNLQNFENERTISMENKKFLTWENAGKVAAGLFVLKQLTKRDAPLPQRSRTITTRNGHVPYGPEFGGL